MHLPVSFVALFLSVILLQLSSGSTGPLDALSGRVLGFTNGEIGLLGSAHFFGFFIGCWFAPRILGSVGHARAFAAFTALGAIGLLAHMMMVNPYAWALFRIAIGICIAGSYTVVESWLQSEVTNENRGKAMGGYRSADIIAQLAAQLMIGVLTPASYLSYNILAIICCAAILPLTLTKTKAPAIPQSARLEPFLAWRISPLALIAVIVAALSNASFRMVGPIYGDVVGLSQGEIALFMAAWLAGGAIAQIPVGWLADRYNRRSVMTWLSAAAIISCIATVATTGESVRVVLLMALFFGLTTIPIFSVAAAHAHDFASSEHRVSLSASLMFWFAVGGIAAPWLSSVLIDLFGPAALFSMISLGHLGLIMFSVFRSRARPAEARTRYLFAPRTSFIIGKLMGEKRER